MKYLVIGASRLGIDLTPDQVDRFQAYYEELIDWNSRINLTAITDYQDVQIKHFFDSLIVVGALPQPITSALRLIDVGSGGGFPGLPLKIVLPQIQLVLLESTKKVEFLRHMAQALALVGVSIVSSRAEEAAHIHEYRERFDVVVARGLAEMSVLAELTLPFCRIGGLLVALKKGEISEEMNASRKAMVTLGGRLAEVKPVNLPEFNDNRCLVVVEKIAETPPRFPRRAGMPAKRPLY